MAQDIYSFFDKRGTFDDVLPSGVPFGLKKMRTDDQDDMLKKAKRDPWKAIKWLLGQTLTHVGDRKEADIGAKFVDKMLISDVQYALIKMRQHGFQGEYFTFTFKFPLAADETVEEKKEFSIDYADIDVKPYKWVRDKIEELKQEGTYEDNGVFPVVFDTYEDLTDMLSGQTWSYPDSPLKVSWSIPTEYTDVSASAKAMDLGDYLTALELRNAKYIKGKVKSEDGQEETIMDRVEWKRLPAEVSSEFFKHVLDVEANVDTTYNIQSQNGKNAVVNIILTPEFFTPSLAS